MVPRRDVRNRSAGRDRQASAASRRQPLPSSLDLASSSDDFWSRPVASVPRGGMLDLLVAVSHLEPGRTVRVPQRRRVVA